MMPLIAIMMFWTVGMNTALESPGPIILQSTSGSTLESTTDSSLDSSTYSTTYSTIDSTLGYVTASAPQTATVKATGWDAMATSKNYINNKLVLESVSPFSPQYISKSYSEGTAGMVCGKICAANAKCQAFNLYPTNSHYICEYLHENFCFPRQRMALQAWSGGTVWDKLHTGMTRACIDQKFAAQASTSYCRIGRFGCQSTWPNCDTCVKTCSDCKTAYSLTGLYNCTLWPEDAFHPPIFAYCSNTATFFIQRQINLFGQGSYARTDYRMPFPDVNRLSKLQVYKSLTFLFNASDNTKYLATYKNFAIDSSGTLMNMTWKSGSGYDGFKTGNNPLTPAPWVITNSFSYCGSFWLLNSTQGSLATTYCPGGGVNMYGNIYTIPFLYPNSSGIRWPQVTKLLTYADVKMDL